MKKITNFIVDHCYIVLVVMIVIAGLCTVISKNVKINHDIMKYMPESSETSQGLAIMDQEFSDVKTSNYTIMFEDLDSDDKYALRNYFESVDGVSSVSYDDSANYNVEKDGVKYTLYSIDVKGDADDDVAQKVYNEIHNHLKDTKNEDNKEKYTFYEKGDVASSNGTVLNPLIIVLAVGVALLIITIMSESYIEPWLYLVSILIAVLINKGTNIIFPNVSHITNSIAAILQLALSMDYSIMLAERYRQERAHEKDKKKAMRTALAHSFSSISASSVTTIVGLIVLVFMSFTIGRDMGLVLSKGVLLSLISIFTTLPAFLLIFDKWIINSKKKAPRFNVFFMGKYAFSIRHIAMPIFLIIFFGSMVLKGNIGIEYTGASNNKIAEIFEETNQTAIIYKNEDEARLAKICKAYENNVSVKEVLCFGNTIGEPEKATEIKDKAVKLGSKMDVEDYLIKTLYYHYYDPNETNTLSLAEFVDFIQNDVINNEHFANDLNSSTRSEIDRLSYFTIPSKITSEQPLSVLSNILEIDMNSLKKVFVLYGNNNPGSKLGKSISYSTMTLPDFVSFINNDVLTNPEYAGEISAAAKSQLAELNPLVDKVAINTQMNATKLSKFLSIEQSTIEQVFFYQAYLNHASEIAQIQAEAESNIAAEVERQITSIIQNQITEQITAAIINGQIPNTDEAKANFAATIQDTVKEQVMANYYENIKAAVIAAAQPSIEATTNTMMANLAAEASAYTNSPSQLISFLVQHQNDERISSNLSESMLSKLYSAKIVMDAVNSDQPFSYVELAKTFGLDAGQLRLLYSFRYINYINSNPSLSVQEIVSFLNSNVVNNPKYSQNLSFAQINKLSIATDLIDNALSGTKYSSKAMYGLLSPLSSNLKSNLVDLLYMYYGSLYLYDESWTMSLEQFVHYLNTIILKDARFNDRIAPEKRDMIEEANAKIADAKRMLVGNNYSRAIINTTLEAEGDDTFSFLEALKNDIATSNATAYVIGNSSMALEMSKSFNDELNFITILTMISIFIVVMITFKSIIIPLILVLIIQSAVWITMSILSFTGSSV